MSDYSILSGPDRLVWWQWTRGLIVLGAIAAGIVTTPPHPAWSGRGLAIGVLVVLCVAVRLPVVFHTPGRIILITSVLLLGIAGTALTLITPQSAAVAFVAFAVTSAIQAWPLPYSVGLTLALGLAYVLGQLAIGSSLGIIGLGPAVIGGSVLIGVVRRQNAILVAESAQVMQEKARSAALDERARIAREIHDVLAHALAALSLQLESADALLESGRVEQAHASVMRASKLAREGMAETRRAIGALRGDILPLPELLSGLARAYEADLGAAASVRVEGVPRDLRPDVGLTIYRTAQEAITNVRKHAPGADLHVTLDYESEEVALEIVNGAAPGVERPLTTTGGGYGLTGLRERAELAGGRFEAAPTAPAQKEPEEPKERLDPGEEVDSPDAKATREGWRVSVRIPA